MAAAMPHDAVLLVNLSGRGDKDVLSVQRALGGTEAEG
jgi:tryptophan synthase beta chain